VQTKNIYKKITKIYNIKMGEIEQVWADSTYNNVVTSNHAYISSRNPKHYKFNHSMWYNQKKITNSKNSYFFFDGNPPQKNGFFT